MTAEHNPVFKPTALVPLAIMIGAGVTGHIWKDGLPWNGWAFLGFTIAWSLVRIAFETKIGSVGKASDRREMALLMAVFAGMMIVPLVHIATPCFVFASVDWPDWVHAAALATGGLGLVVFYRSHVDLDRQWSVSLAIKDDHQLVDHGVYAWVRHPMYAALFLIVIAQAGLLDNWLAGFAGMAAFGLLYALRVGREEALMDAKFGDSWRRYAAETPRIIPRFTRRRSRGTV